MKRLTTASLAITAAFALSACKGGGGAAAKYIPDGAQFAMGANVASLAKEGIFADLKKMAEKEDKMGGVAMAKECNIDVWALESVTMAGTDKEDMVAIVVGDGIGKADNIKCLAGKAKEKMGGEKEPLTIDGNTINVEGGEVTGYMVDDKTLVVASKSWAGKVKELVDGGGKSASDGSLKDVLGNVDSGKHLWAAGNLPEGMQKQAQGAKSGWGSLDFSGGGLAVDGSAVFADEATAKKIAEEANKAKGDEQAKAMAGKTVESASVEASGSNVKFSAKMPKEEFDKLKGMASAFM